MDIDPESVTEERAMCAAATSFTSAAVDAAYTANNNDFQGSRSRAVTEASLARMAAGSINTNTVAGSLKRARNMETNQWVSKYQESKSCIVYSNINQIGS